MKVFYLESLELYSKSFVNLLFYTDIARCFLDITTNHTEHRDGFDYDCFNVFWPSQIWLENHP